MKNSISIMEKDRLDRIINEVLKQEWEPEANIQKFYEEFYVSPHYGFYHRGHEYLITVDQMVDGKKVWVIYDRDLNDEEFKYNDVWSNEPKSIFEDLSTLIFVYKLKNDGRCIADYICDYNNLERLII